MPSVGGESQFLQLHCLSARIPDVQLLGRYFNDHFRFYFKIYRADLLSSTHVSTEWSFSTVQRTRQVFKVIWHEAASPPQTDGSIVFARWRQCALPLCLHIGVGATWQVQLNLCFFWPTRAHNPNGKSIGSAIFAQLKAECRYTL